MRTHRIRVSIAISCFCLLWVGGFTSLPPRELLGIAPQDEGYYKSDVIKCKDGSKKFTKQQLNDEFCDCPDGTDEPGTSACPEGEFYCRNAGHIPRTIFSSRVNDGVCDCCDGSDEYNGKSNCPNTCWEAGKSAREKLKKKIATHQDGLAIRKQELEKAKQAFAEDEAELLKLKNEEKILKGLVEKLREHKERIEKAEEEERLRKEKEEKKQREAERKSTEQNRPSEESAQYQSEGTQDTPMEMNSQDSVEIGHEPVVPPENEYNSRIEIPAVHNVGQKQVADNIGESITSGHGSDDVNNEIPSGHAADQEHISGNTEGLSREELGRLVASRWTGEHAEERTNEPNDANGEQEEQNQDFSDSAEEENYDSYNSDNDEDRHKFDDDDIQDVAAEEYGNHVEPDGSYDHDKDYKSEFPGSPSWLDKIKQTVQNIIQAFSFFKSPVDLSVASRVKKEYDDASSKLSKIQSRISGLSEKLKHDFGKEKDFYSFYDRCFENKQNKYIYKVCPFKKASQVEGHSSTQLGRWENFDESYRVMQFSNGDRCWNGPDRSLKVRLRCGLKDDLADVDEPSRCEYVAILSTPIICLEEKLKELQQKLEDMNKRQPSTHDEL
ncbi:glucosidase 2 subunit beta-like isoform X1 [Musa acuminata AAA Group]|uniref:Glucosidase 2 subunit beta n=1 Tax=Musa acuminata subsp. malaccensis TaxID=214687 RepID=A0A804JA47_MUSAM|nr:PREDICTED: glucosidase 2 subunit beta-like isoform X1 [Musa acuminata subsp. malaccensis]